MLNLHKHTKTIKINGVEFTVKALPLHIRDYVSSKLMEGKKVSDKGELEITNIPNPEKIKEVYYLTLLNGVESHGLEEDGNPVKWDHKTINTIITDYPDVAEQLFQAIMDISTLKKSG